MKELAGTAGERSGSKGLNIALWAAQIVLALAFGMFGLNAVLTGLIDFVLWGRGRASVILPR